MVHFQCIHKLLLHFYVHIVIVSFDAVDREIFQQ